MIITNEFKIGKFAKKQVHRLEASASLWEAIELMNDFRLRHVPVVKGMKLVGVINPCSLMDGLDYYTDPTTLDQQVSNFVSHDYITVDEHISVLDVIEELAHLPHSCALVLRDSIFQGIYTEMDILRNDYLWSKISDVTLDEHTVVGEEINEFSCVPSHMSIQLALRLMRTFQSEYIGIINDFTNILVGTLSFMDIIHHLIYYSKVLNKSINEFWDDPINTIFPESGLYLPIPLKLSDLRNQMSSSDSQVVILLDYERKPMTMITVHDIVSLYSRHTGLSPYES